MIDKNGQQVYEKIKSMEIRGAEKIAIGAAKALEKISQESTLSKVPDLLSYLQENAVFVKTARPSAVSLPNAVNLVMFEAKKISKKTEDVDEFRKKFSKSVNVFCKDLEDAMQKIATIGAKRIQEGDVCLTHCNSSTAINVISQAWKQGKNIEVVATETRPWGQGYLTVSSFAERGVPVTLIVDSAVRYMIKKMNVSKVVVGADTVTANGAVVNKVGTSQIALAAHEARVQFFVASHVIKFDPRTILGQLEVIEERSPTEITDKKLPGVKIKNPVFDVTPPQYIDLIISELGIFPPQYVITVLREKFGWQLSEIE